MPTTQGAIRLFRFAGVEVFLHWTWFIVALYELQRVNQYRSPVFNVAEFLALVGIVTMHEFGHSLACRQVGGNAERIVLWPLGGVAYVDPPQRPGATLWSIAAGPLVNVALVPVLFGLMLLGRSAGLAESLLLSDTIRMENRGAGRTRSRGPLPGLPVLFYWQFLLLNSRQRY